MSSSSSDSADTPEPPGSAHPLPSALPDNEIDDWDIDADLAPEPPPINVAPRVALTGPSETAPAPVSPNEAKRPGRLIRKDRSDFLDADFSAIPAAEPAPPATLPRIQERNLTFSPTLPDGPAPPSEPGLDPAPRKAPLQRKSGGGADSFTRLTARPEASAASGAFADSKPSLRSVPVDQIGQGNIGGGKIKDSFTPEYQPSRLQDVMDSDQPRQRVRRIRSRGHYPIRILIGFILLLSGLLGYVVYQRSQNPDPNGKNGTAALPVDAITNLPPLAERHNAIRQALKLYLQTPYTEMAQKRQLILHPELLEGRMKDYYLLQKGQDPDVTQLAISQPISYQGGWWFVLSLSAADGSAFTVLAQETPKGPRFDWENLVGFSTMPFPTFVAEKPKTPQPMRVRVRSAEVFSGKYTATDYAAFEISPRIGAPVIRAYAALNPRSAGAVTPLLKPGNDWTAAHLKLHWEADAGGPDVLLIDEVIDNSALQPHLSAADLPTSPLDSPKSSEK